MTLILTSVAKYKALVRILVILYFSRSRSPGIHVLYLIPSVSCALVSNVKIDVTDISLCLKTIEFGIVFIAENICIKIQNRTRDTLFIMYDT